MDDKRRNYFKNFLINLWDSARHYTSLYTDRDASNTEDNFAFCVYNIIQFCKGIHWSRLLVTSLCVSRFLMQVWFVFYGCIVSELLWSIRNDVKVGTLSKMCKNKKSKCCNIRTIVVSFSFEFVRQFSHSLNLIFSLNCQYYVYGIDNISLFWIDC